MSTTAFAPEIGTSGLYNSSSIMPKEKDVRTIVREEIKRQKDLDQLEQKHDAGEISDFEYRAQKFLLNLPIPNVQSVDHLKCNCVA